MHVVKEAVALPCKIMFFDAFHCAAPGNCTYMLYKEEKLP